jgi:hypothetical protein
LKFQRIYRVYQSKQYIFLRARSKKVLWGITKSKFLCMDQVVGGVGRDNNEKVNTVPFMSQAGK